MAVPTAQELLDIALINRARLDPAAEAALYSIDLNEGLAAGTITAASKQPLAFDTSLETSAQGHSQAMITNSFFAHDNPITGSTPQSRGTAAGYAGGVGENIAANGSSVALDPTATVFVQHLNLFVDSGVVGRGHRTNMMNASYQQVGVGTASGVTTIFGQPFNTIVMTEDFGIPNVAGQFITGITYNDTDINNFYSVGEGRSGMTVTTSAGSTTSIAAGGYARSIGSGVQAVTFSGGGLAGTISLNARVTAGRNILIDIVGQTKVVTSTSIAEVSGIDTIVGLGTIGLTLTAGGGAESVFGAKGDDIISGGAGNDSLTGGLGNDTIDGGSETDTAYYTGNRAAYTVTNNSGVWTIAGADGTDTLTNVEFAHFADQTIVLAVGDQTLTGDDNPNVISGDAGNDTISGLGGNDTLSGGGGNDFIDGGLGNDTLNGGSGNDTLLGRGGTNTMIGGPGNDVYYVQGVNDIVTELAGEGTDTNRPKH